MKVHLIQQYFDKFAQYLEADAQNQVSKVSKNLIGYGRHAEHLYSFLSNFAEKWRVQDELAPQIDDLLQSQVSRRLWFRENFDAKQMMITFTTAEPDYTEQMFRDLLNEEKAVDARVDRFRFYCDELFEIFKNAHPASIQTSHDQDATMISLYLAGVFPEKYSIYPGLPIFADALAKIEARDIPQVDDLDRYFKATKVFCTLAQKNEKLWHLHLARFMDQPSWLTYRLFGTEIISFIADH